LKKRDLVISEEQARRLWERAAELQAERFLADSGRMFEVSKDSSFPPKEVWLSLEEALTGDGLELLEVRGRPMDQGGAGIFESP